MRRTFAEILRSGGIDYEVEYDSLYDFVFEVYGFYAFVRSHFRQVPFAGTATSLDDFNTRYDLDFESYNESPSLDDLLCFCEYCYNFAVALLPVSVLSGNDYCDEVIRHVDMLADKLNHVFVDDNGIKVLVSKDANTLAAAAVAPAHLGNDLIRYDYRMYDGDLESKKAILLRLIGDLEPKRKRLEALSKSMAGDLFFIANNMNLRHNNADPQDEGKYKRFMADMGAKELEGWYDLCRDLCAAAYLMLSYDNQRDALKVLKDN